MRHAAGGITMNRNRSAAVSTAAWCACLVLISWLSTLARAEVARFEFSPVSIAGRDTLHIDLGGPVRNVNSMVFSASGTISRELWQCQTEGGAFTGHTETHIGVRMTFGEQQNTWRWYEVIYSDGAFNFNAPLAPYGNSPIDAFLASGVATLVLYCMSDNFFAHGVCFLDHDGIFSVLDHGSLEFSAAPAIEIEYEMEVSSDHSTFGAIKAQYR